MANILYKKLGRRSRKGIRVRIVDLLKRYEKYIAIEVPADISRILGRNGFKTVWKNGKSYVLLPLNGNILRELEEILEKGLGVVS